LGVTKNLIGQETELERQESLLNSCQANLKIAREKEAELAAVRPR
jgi:hypothetical protein